MGRILVILFFITRGAMGFDFFSGEINYWNEEKKEVTKPKKKEEKKDKFDWDKFKNPKNKEFFKEGDYTPPEPFMELARNPTDENIKNWFELIETKNKLMGRLHEKMQDYLKTKSNELTKEEISLVEEQMKKTKISNIDIKRFRFLLYFESSCPHCKRMIKTMQDLQSLGYYVEVRQIDRKKPQYPIPFPLLPASKNEILEKKIDAWPVLFVADTTKKLIYRMNGFQETNHILDVLKNK